MALIGRKISHHFRTSNKEPEWSSLCNNVFDQYLDGDDPFACNESHRASNSSHDSGNLFDFSGASGQSNQTSATSPIPSLSEGPPSNGTDPGAKQPKAKAPGNFWMKKLRALEQNAAECEKRQQKLRATKSHPDFLSLGGYPSPAALPTSSVVDQSHSAQRYRSPIAANGKKTPTLRSVTSSRSVSRGRPSGVMKPPASTAVNSNATIRMSNASPPKMMNPSRYRAGFKDVWAERIELSPKKYELRVPVSTFPDSPPPSSRLAQDAFAAFRSPIAFPSSTGRDDQISPLANIFQQAARIHTPITSPLVSPRSHAALSYFDPPPPPLPVSLYTTQTVPLNDTAPLYPGNILAANKIQTFDFGFSSSPVEDAWSAASFSELSATSYNGDFLTHHGTFHDLDALTGCEAPNFELGIGCNPNAPAVNYTTAPNNPLLASDTYHSQPMPIASPFYVSSLPAGLAISPTRQPHGLPTTPRRRDLSGSPSPPATEPRSRRASSSRKASRHRRTKSTHSTPRHPQGGETAGFVNFTPQDSTKILSGVAPSGSSKTKARREKEAAEKRRRLSQAAMRAVMEAGGDVERLQKAGFT